MSDVDSLDEVVNPENVNLWDYEEFWRDHFSWLEERGYLLRPRYRPGWIASWIGSNERRQGFEDYQTPVNSLILDATRISNGKPVMLRRPDPPSVSDEREIGQLLSSERLRSDPRNHCVPIYDTLQAPNADSEEGESIVVMPYLIPWREPGFETVGEVVDFCSQIFEGLQFMHSLNVAHNDAKDTNIMMDWSPIYPSPPHFSSRFKTLDWSGASKPRGNRTLFPVKYYFIDWDLSKRYDAASGPVLQRPGYGGDQSVPEFKRNELVNPFAVDVYCLGNVIRKKFLVGDPMLYVPPKRNLKFLEGLISDMTHDDPTKRPTMDEVVSRFAEIRKKLNWWKLRSRVSSKEVPLFFHLLYGPIHWTVQLSYILRRIPAIPDYTRNRENSSA